MASSWRNLFNLNGELIPPKESLDAQRRTSLIQGNEKGYIKCTYGKKDSSTTIDSNIFYIVLMLNRVYNFPLSSSIFVKQSCGSGRVSSLEMATDCFLPYFF